MKGEANKRLEKLLREKIPLVKALKAEIRKVHPDCVELWAPLAPNHNHMGSAFGGSISALLILGGYTWLYQFMLEQGHDVHVILKSCEIDYKFPIEEDLFIFGRAPAAGEIEKFLISFKRKGLGRIHLQSEIRIEGKKAATLQGEYVVKASDATD
jgi:thioesterase domain-containing protein